MSTHERYALLPRDGLFCKDGRGWSTSTSGRGHGLDWPWPSTVLGALRSAWGRGEEEKAGRRFERLEWRERTASIALHRTLALRRSPGASWTEAHRVWPVPADARWLEGQDAVHRLDPLPPGLPTLGRDDDEAREALWRSAPSGAGKPLPAPRWWGERSFAAWLAGQPVQARGAGDTFEAPRRVQVRVSIQPELLTAAENELFSHDVVETLDRDGEWAIGVEAVLPGGELQQPVTLGSDSRLARVEPLPERAFELPSDLLKAFRTGSAGLRLVVVSPAFFQAGWLPDGLQRRESGFRGEIAPLGGELVLRAALVPRPLHVSGWDMAEGKPKPTARMVPPGAVYFFERADGRPFGEVDARALWLAAVGGRTGEGFGRVVPGIWNPRRSE
jgi:CRISPR-associated protein Cmr3